MSTHGERGDMSTKAREKVRQELLLDVAGGREVPISQVDYYVKQQHPSASVSQVQQETLATIRSLATDGLVVLGAMSGPGGRWETWDEPVEVSMRKIAALYIPDYDDPPAWGFSSWLGFTEKGKQAAEALQAKPGTSVDPA